MSSAGEGDRPNGGGLLRTAGIMAVVCICGWLVMQMEILGGRMLAPYFGSAIYVVMGSVIGVFLLSLSGGYLLGGWLSGRRWNRRVLGIALMVAGAWLAAVPRANEPLCDGLLDAGFGQKWGSLVAALTLFGVPTVLLGTVSPIAVRWLTRDASRSGFNAGLVLAFSTIASFGGCVVTAFYLLRMSTGRTVTVSGGVLLALGLALLARGLLSPPEAEVRNQENARD
ncbi:MAG: fused MFS/spermidine synthase [Planctomycetota bacterium]